MTILIINNYSDEKDIPRTRKIEEALKEEGESDCLIWHFSEVGSKKIPENLKAVILSGSRAHLQDPDVYSKYEPEIDLIIQSDIPVLGICFGHQLIGKVFGSAIGSLPRFIDKCQDIEVLESDDILKSWNVGQKLRVRQSHRDFLVNLPQKFTCLARSEKCKIEAMKHKTRPIYGIQAHIERSENKNPDGFQVLRNFLDMVNRRSRDCVFCKIARDQKSFKGKPEGRIRWITENKHFFAILDLHPKVTGHTLVISKRHSDDITELDENKVRSLGHILVKTAKLLKESLNAEKIYVMTMCEHWEPEEISPEWKAGQDNPIFTEHTHFHLLPRYRGMRTKGIAQENMFTRSQDYGCTLEMLSLVKQRIACTH